MVAPLPGQGPLDARAVTAGFCQHECLTIKHLCDDLCIEGRVIMGKPRSAAHAHSAVLALTRHRLYTQRESLWKSAISSGQSNVGSLIGKAIQLAAVCPAGHVIISEELYNELPDDSRRTYLIPQKFANYNACRTVPRGRRCFCVLPLGTENSPERRSSDFVFKYLITPACEQLDYLPVHPLKQQGADVWSDIANSLQAYEHVIVYLGSQPYNANVMLELGYRLATGKPLVVLASEGGQLPFDLRNHRTVFLPADPTSMENVKVEQLISDIVEKMHDRAANDLGWGDLYPTATIEIDTRPVAPPLRDHKVADASQQTANLFAMVLPDLIGSSPAAVMERLRELMEPRQYAAFEEEQQRLYAEIEGNMTLARGSRDTVYAQVPIVLTSHPGSEFFLRAYLPAVLSHEQIGNRSLQRVAYFDVSRHIRRDEEGISHVPRPAPNLDFVFASYARAYDAVLLELPNYRAAVEQHCSLIAPRPSMKILDVGAGTGNVTVRLLEAGAYVTAVDRSPEMLSILANKCVKYKYLLTRITHDCSDLSMLKDEFDVANILLVLFSVEQPRLVLRQAVRELRPGGMLVVTEPNRTFNLETLLDEAEQNLRNNGRFDSLREQWELVKKVNRSFETVLRNGWKAENVEAELRLLGWEDITHSEAYMSHCTTLQAIKPI